MNVDKLKELGIPIRATGGQTKTKCPQCSHTRKSSNKNEPCLSVNIDEGIYNCHNCGWNGHVGKIKTYTTPTWSVDYIQPNTRTEVERFFEKRKISSRTIQSQDIRQVKQFIPKDQKEVNCIAFPYKKNNKVVNIKYRSLNQRLQDG